jgi:hypothetical protein
MRAFAIFANLASIAAGSWCLQVGLAEPNRVPVIGMGVIAIALGSYGLLVVKR